MSDDEMGRNGRMTMMNLPPIALVVTFGGAAMRESG